jgi:hypothetical protein
MTASPQVSPTAALPGKEQEGESSGLARGRRTRAVKKNSKVYGPDLLNM